MTQQVDTKLDLLRNIYDVIRSGDHLQYLNIAVPSITPEEIRYDRTGRFSAWLALEAAANSIDDITHHREGLAFVGLLGHFSSGKSTLINALLNEPTYRTTESNPTDTDISLICQPNAYEDLKANTFTSVDGIHIEIAPQLDFLDGVVLVDTPGLGNLKGEHELAEQFLHLCHVVVITIDGSVPLADTAGNFQLLDKAINKLASVPKIFAITKSFTFLPDRKSDFGAWDQAKADRVWSGVKDRMLADARFQDKRDIIDQIPVVFIDSVDDFNVAALTDHIVALVNDPSQRPRIFEAQANYLVRVARESIGVFQQYLTERLANLDELHKEAKRKATEAKEMLNRRTDSVNNAIVTADKKINDINDAVQLLQEQLEFPKPSAGLLGESFDGFSKVLSKMESQVTVWSADCVEAASDNVRRQAKSMFRSFGFRRKHFSRDALTTICDRPAQLATPSDMSAWLRRMNDYADTSCRWVAREIPSKWSIDKSSASANSIQTAFREAFQSLTGGLGIFMTDYNVAARAFVAYLIQPDSKRLLKECGLILFDEDEEERALQAAEITNEDFSSRAAIDELVQSLRVQMDEISDQEHAALRELDRQFYSHQLVSPQITTDQVVGILNDDQYSMKRKSEIKQFGDRMSSHILNSLEEIGGLRKSMNSRLREVALQWIEIIVKAAVLGFGVYFLLLLIKTNSISMYDRLWVWITKATGPIFIALLATAISETFKFIFGQRWALDSRDKYSLGLRPIFNFVEAKAVVEGVFETRWKSEKEHLKTLLRNIPIDMSHRIHAAFKAQFEGTEENKSVVNIGRTLKEFRKQRITAYGDGRAKFATNIASLRQELSTNPEKKRKESVDRVLDRISETRDLVRKLSLDLKTHDDQLAD